MRTLSAGPAGVRKEGEIVDVPDDEGQELVRGGYAVEYAALAPAENAVLRAGRPALEALGGGYYLLPNGEKVKGKRAAEDALASLTDEAADEPAPAEPAGGEEGGEDDEPAPAAPAGGEEGGDADPTAENEERASGEDEDDG
jgi:hypothetical protein